MGWGAWAVAVIGAFIARFAPSRVVLDIPPAKGQLIWKGKIMATTGADAFLESAEFERALANDNGLAAKQHLAAGRPIYYGDARYPEGLVKKYPDGHRQLVSVSAEGEISVIRDI